MISVQHSRGFTRPGQRGIALFLTLLMTGVLVIVVTALLGNARGGSVFSQDFHAKRAAYLAAESGVSVLQQRLSDNPTYNSTVTSEATPFETGSYSYRFNSSNCINNLEGTTPVAGPYGEVPAGSAYIKVTGEALGHKETIECMLGRKDSDFIAAAAVASGKVFLDGDVVIEGRHSNGLMTQTSADIISNYNKDTWSGHRPLHYIQESGEQAKIDGVVRSASPSAGAISPDLVAAANRAVTNQNPVPLRNVDVKSLVDAKSSVNRVPPATSTTLDQIYYKNGDYVVPGDLTLDDGELYVKGDLTVVGSIKGRGSVYVDGDTIFSGDSAVSSKEDGIALYASGNVSLTGFNGSTYMEAITLSAGGNYNLQWRQTKDDFALLASYIGSGNEARFAVGSSDPNTFWGSDIGKLLLFMSNNAASHVRHPTLGLGAQENNLFDLGQLVDQQPDSPSQRFMLRKFLLLRGSSVATSYNGSSDNLDGVLGITYSSDEQTETAKIKNFVNNDQLSNGLFNKLVWIKTSRVEGSNQYAGVTNAEIDKGLIKAANWLQNFEYDKLGSSYFQGAIYCRGAFYADNEVTLVGSVAVVADPKRADSRPDFHPVSGVTLRPGDLYLGNGTNITFVSDIAPGAQESAPKVGISFWLK